MASTIPGTVITFDLETTDEKVQVEKESLEQQTVIDMRGVEGE